MIKNGITKKNTLLHQARPGKIELAAVKHYSVKQYVLFSYLVLSDAEINENMLYVHSFRKIAFHYVEHYA